MTTFDPGAREVFTWEGVEILRLMAFLAINPAPIRTEGLEVLVQEVMAAMTMLPSPIFAGPPLS